jgi:hypothetical protein
LRRPGAGPRREEFVANAVTVNIVNLFESIEIEEKQGMAGAGVRGSTGSGFECIVKLAPVGKTGEGILKCQLADALFSLDSSTGFAGLLAMAPRGENQQAHAKYSAEA